MGFQAKARLASSDQKSVVLMRPIEGLIQGEHKVDRPWKVGDTVITKPLGSRIRNAHLLMSLRAV